MLPKITDSAENVLDTPNLIEKIYILLLLILCSGKRKIILLLLFITLLSNLLTVLNIVTGNTVFRFENEKAKTRENFKRKLARETTKFITRKSEEEGEIRSSIYGYDSYEAIKMQVCE